MQQLQIKKNKSDATFVEQKARKNQPQCKILTIMKSKTIHPTYNSFFLCKFAVSKIH